MRLPGWELALSDYLEQATTMAFVWGEHDCCLMAANAAKLVNGVDYAAAFRDHYSTEIGAARALKRLGKGGLKETLLDVLGTPVPPLLLQRGDVVLVHYEGRHSAGVNYAGQYLVTGKDGLKVAPRSSFVLGWRIV